MIEISQKCVSEVKLNIAKDIKPENKLRSMSVGGPNATKQQI